MQSANNKFIIASAGSGKTRFLVEEALSRLSNRIAILTYTNNNKNEIKDKFHDMHGVIPKNVDIMTWFTFLLRECTRPYQRSVYPDRRVKTIEFPKGRSARYVSHNDIKPYYFKNGDEIYSDKISRFIIDCENNSKGLVTKRLADIYDDIFIDEFQDLSGWDLDLLEVFLQAGFRMRIVGDPRQCTYTTHNASKNRQFCGIGLLQLISDWEAKKLCCIDGWAWSHRCNQQICDFADKLWPDMVKTVSRNNAVTGHDGVFVVSKDNYHEYVNVFSPKILRYDRRTKTSGYPALNFRVAKGLEFNRILIVPNGPIKKYLRSENVEDIRKSRERFYVAITRAKHSVAFLYDGLCGCGCIEWKPD